jgi:predicted DCC family thiol-disulfide oxidoreductase YuxK
MNVILFDGVCNWCNGTVNWIIDHDKKNQFKFATLQSGFGRQQVEKYGLHNQYLDTVVLIENEQVYLRSTAILRILKRMGGIYSLAYIFVIIPAPILDFFYNIVARYRYTWFCKRDNCRVPDKGLEDKFIE